MKIIYDETQKVFHLSNGRISYIMQVLRDGYLFHLYWGKGIRDYHLSNGLFPYVRSFSPSPYFESPEFSTDSRPGEFPGYGCGDFRSPIVQCQRQDGSTLTDLRVVSHEIIQGKPPLEGLPASYVKNDSEAMTLSICMEDRISGLRATLLYTIFEKYDVICRSARYENVGKESLKLLQAGSMSLDFQHCDYDLITLWGGHANERNLQRRPLSHGITMIDSKRGASSHQYAPFLCLTEPAATEDQGKVYGFNLVYSGNFAALAEVDQFNLTRVQMGINPFDFCWLLETGEAFQAPETVMVFSSEGLGEMSRTYHRFYRERLCRGKFQFEERPILINNWEATYFNFDSKKILDIAQKGKELGMELFVLDDGWFGHRDNDKSSLGDWTVFQSKIPEGIDGLAKKITDMGIRFGLWFEPEMISVDSDLYRAHPDWCLHVKDRSHTFSRSQLVLDFSRKDVCDYIVEAVCKVLSGGNISYVKWDMNRHMTDIGSALLPAGRQRETAHRYMLGVYDVMNRITSAFPDVLFESCSGGGGRFDPGILYYMPQTWTSDNTDAVCRLKIQYGTSLTYPIVSMGSHVSVAPNHQMGRTTPMDTRGYCAMSGAFGYELDITRLSKEDEQMVREQVAFYKKIRKTVQYGDFYRLLSPFEGNQTAWSFVEPDKSRAIVMWFQTLNEPNTGVTILHCKGLDPEGLYCDENSGRVFGGDELMEAGLSIPLPERDFDSKIFILSKVQNNG